MAEGAALFRPTRLNDVLREPVFRPEAVVRSTAGKPLNRSWVGMTGKKSQ